MIFDSAEVLIRPDRFFENSISLKDQINFSFDKCEPELRNNINKKVIITGGASLVKGLKKRL